MRPLRGFNGWASLVEIPRGPERRAVNPGPNMRSSYSRGRPGLRAGTEGRLDDERGPRPNGKPAACEQPTVVCVVPISSTLYNTCKEFYVSRICHTIDDYRRKYRFSNLWRSQDVIFHRRRSRSGSSTKICRGSCHRIGSDGDPNSAYGHLSVAFYSIFDITILMKQVERKMF